MGFGKSILKEDVASPFKIDVAASCDEILKGIGNWFLSVNRVETKPGLGTVNKLNKKG